MLAELVSRLGLWARIVWHCGCHRTGAGIKGNARAREGLTCWLDARRRLVRCSTMRGRDVRCMYRIKATSGGLENDDMDGYQ